MRERAAEVVDVAGRRVHDAARQGRPARECRGGRGAGGARGGNGGDGGGAAEGAGLVHLVAVDLLIDARERLRDRGLAAAVVVARIELALQPRGVLVLARLLPDAREVGARRVGRVADAVLVVPEQLRELRQHRVGRGLIAGGVRVGVVLLVAELDPEPGQVRGGIPRGLDVARVAAHERVVVDHGRGRRCGGRRGRRRRGRRGRRRRGHIADCRTRSGHGPVGRVQRRGDEGRVDGRLLLGRRLVVADSISVADSH